LFHYPDDDGDDDETDASIAKKFSSLDLKSLFSFSPSRRAPSRSLSLARRARFVLPSGPVSLEVLSAFGLDKYRDCEQKKQN